MAARGSSRETVGGAPDCIHLAGYLVIIAVIAMIIVGQPKLTRSLATVTGDGLGSQPARHTERSVHKAARVYEK